MHIYRKLENYINNPLARSPLRASAHQPVKDNSTSLGVICGQHVGYPTRPKKIAEDGVYMRVTPSVMHSCSRKASLKCKTDPYHF